MGSVELQNVDHQYGGQIVLAGVNCTFHSGQIVGLVGPNGAGKTTLLRIIAGLLTPDHGKVARSRDLRIGYLAQEPNLDPQRPLKAEVASVFDHIDAWENELHAASDAIAATQDEARRRQLLQVYDRLHAQIEAAGGYRRDERIGEVLSGLGFSTADLELPVGVLSGGQKCRAALAKLLLADDELLLLDEPTNHLDIDAVRFLERFLGTHRGGAVIVSHDRYLLDRLVERIVEVDRTTVRSYSGNYSNYAATRERDRLTRERQQAKDAELIRRERDFIARHLAGQRTSEAKGRRKRLERRLVEGAFVLEKEPAPAALRMAFDNVERIEGQVLRGEELGKGFGGAALFANLSLTLEAGMFCGITGPNGTGKTTLLRVLCGELAADSGTVSVHARAQVGYFAQQAGTVTDDHTVLDAVLTGHPRLGEQRVRDLLARFGFRGEAVFKTRTQLSGGEQSRLRLLLLLLEAPNVLMLDEPTNHLDISAREALEAALAEYPGTVLAVSHDRYFLDRLVDQLLVLRPNGHALHAGNYTSYIAAQEQARSQAAARARPAAQRAARRPSTAETAKAVRPTAIYDALSIEEIEERIVAQEERIAELHARFADPEAYRNAETVSALNTALRSLQAELEVLESAWSERAEHL